MDFQGLGAVFEVVLLRDGFPGQFALLPHGNDTHTRGVRHGGGNHEPACFHTGHAVILPPEGVDQGVHRSRESITVREQRGEVSEQYPRFRVVRDLGAQPVNHLLYGFSHRTIVSVVVTA